MLDTLTQITLKGDLLNAREVAKYLRKSISWVYKHKHELGGRKLGGSLFFPKKEELYERLFNQRKGMEIRLPDEQGASNWSVFQNKNRGQTSGSKKKGGDNKSKEKDTDRDGPNRYGLLDIG